MNDSDKYWLKRLVVFMSKVSFFLIQPTFRKLKNIVKKVFLKWLRFKCVIWKNHAAANFRKEKKESAISNERTILYTLY